MGSGSRWEGPESPPSTSRQKATPIFSLRSTVRSHPSPTIRSGCRGDDAAAEIAPGCRSSANPCEAARPTKGTPMRYWREIQPEFKGTHAHAVALLIEEGALFDSESRDFIVSLTQRARLRPFLIVITLDTTVRGATLWEERLLGQGDIDWIRPPNWRPTRGSCRHCGHFRQPASALAPRGGHDRPPRGQRREVVLSRVSRLNFSQLARRHPTRERVGLVRVGGGERHNAARSVDPARERLLPGVTSAADCTRRSPRR